MSFSKRPIAISCGPTLLLSHLSKYKADLTGILFPVLSTMNMSVAPSTMCAAVKNILGFIITEEAKKLVVLLSFLYVPVILATHSCLAPYCV